MDALTFIEKMTADSAWPVTAVVLAVILLRRAKFLAGIVKSIKYKDIEIVLRDQLTAAGDLYLQVAAGEGEPLYQRKAIMEDSDIVRMAKIDAGMAIVRIWQDLEAELIKLIRHNGLIRFTTIERFIDRLHQLGKLSDVDVALFQALRNIRNSVMHRPYSQERPITVAEVVEYEKYVEALAHKLGRIKMEPGYIDLE